MDIIIKELAQLLGVSPQLIEGGLLTLALLAIIGLVRLLFQTSKNDARQIGFEQRLVDLTASSVEQSRQSVEESKLLRLAYEKNVEAIQRSTEVTLKNSQVLEEIRDAFKGLGDNLVTNLTAAAQQAADLRVAIEAHGVEVGGYAESVNLRLINIERNLIKSTPTTVVFRDEAGVDVASFTATPETSPDGSMLIVITFKDLPERSELIQT